MGPNNIVTFIDDYSRMVFVCPIKAKSEVFEKFKMLKAQVDTHYDLNIRCIRLDNAGEYISKRFNQHHANQGIYKSDFGTLLSATQWSCRANESLLVKGLEHC